MYMYIIRSLQIVSEVLWIGLNSGWELGGFRTPATLPEDPPLIKILLFPSL